MKRASLLLLVLLAGCGSSNSSNATKAKEVSPAGDIPDNQAFVRYSPPGAGFSVKVPEGWSRSTRNGMVTFTDKLNAISMRTAAGRRPSASAEVRRLSSAYSGFHQPRSSVVTRAGTPVTRITFLASARTNPVTGKGGIDAVEEYVYAHAGKQLYLVLSGPKAADNVDPWRLVSDSVRWTA